MTEVENKSACCPKCGTPLGFKALYIQLSVGDLCTCAHCESKLVRKARALPRYLHLLLVFLLIYEIWFFGLFDHFTIYTMIVIFLLERHLLLNHTKLYVDEAQSNPAVSS